MMAHGDANMTAYAITACEHFLTFTPEDHAHYAFIDSTMITNVDGHLSPQRNRSWIGPT
jgi:hypothetical protein